jgi:HlyD family secretion protein
VSGSVAAWDELPVGAELTGLRIERIFVEEGDRVRRGQVLAQLNDWPLRAQLKQVEAEIARARAVLAQQQAVLAEAAALRREAETNRRRFVALERQGAISALEAEARRTGADTASARLVATEGAVAVAEGDLARAEARREELLATLAQTRIVAPTDGTLSERRARLGAVITPQNAAGLFILVRDGRYELRAEVSEVYLGVVRPGQAVAVNIDAVPGRVLTGRVREIAPTVDARARDALVRIDLPADPALRPGMFARGEVRLAATAALTVPEGAVLYSEGQPFVWTIVGGVAHRRTIQTGERQDGRVEVLGGLTAETTVAVDGAGYLSEGVPVRMAEGGR